MGSLFELTYVIQLKSSSKAFIDELRCRNSNLNITLNRNYSNYNGKEL